ncbi:MAG: DUF4373 domain-containing protein [Provencibacterium sp.]|nr:DUF4373 domain-containing protein [Provencibacterium sp.]
MARPLKEGLDYFSLDTGFFQDKKVRLIKSEFGAKGVTVLLALLCEIYGGNGYFKKWDEEDYLLMADAVGCGLSPENISQVVHGCLRRSLFDGKVFKVFGVLTSAGIQRRYIRAVSLREEISFIQEYWLLNLDDKNDVPASVRNKVAFKTVSEHGNPDKKYRNPDKTLDNPKSKEKERNDGDDLKDSELARACARGGGNGGKPSGDEETMQQAETLAARLFPHYFGRPATGHDAELLLGCICRGERQTDGSFGQRIDPDRAQVIEYAFRIASERGAHNWAFVRQVLSTVARRGLHTLDDCEDYDAQREFDKDNGR